MAILTRQTQQVFGSNANADQLAVFGTMKTGTPQYSSNLATLQSKAYKQGWTASVKDNKAPFLEEMNAVQYGFSYQLAYLFQEGIPAYDPNTNYSNTSIVKVIKNNELEFYHSLRNDNLGNPLSDTINWAKAYLTNTAIIGQPQITLDFNTLPQNCIWLEGAEVSRTTYANLFAIYGTTYGEGDGSTTFNLPDCRNRVFWGGTESGYLSAGLPNITGSFNPGEYNPQASGVFKAIYNGSREYSSEWRGYRINFDASFSNSIYGNSTTVQPPALKVRIYTRYQ